MDFLFIIFFFKHGHALVLPVKLCFWIFSLVVQMFFCYFFICVYFLYVLGLGFVFGFVSEEVRRCGEDEDFLNKLRELCFTLQAVVLPKRTFLEC